MVKVRRPGRSLNGGEEGRRPNNAGKHGADCATLALKGAATPAFELLIS